MATEKQILGKFGEKCVIANYSWCPRCKRNSTLKCLPPNFKCADIICDVCGYLAQVKTMTTKNVHKLPRLILGAAWGPQQERIKSGIYFPLFLVLVKSKKELEIYYLPAEFQTKKIFIPRKPLSKNAKRSGWQGFYYDLSKLTYPPIKLLWNDDY